MIPFIRSLSELNAITESRDRHDDLAKNNEISSSTLDSGQSKRYIRSLQENQINLPKIPKILRQKWIKKKGYVSKFFDDLDYNNQIPSSYDLTLLEVQSHRNQEDVA